MVLSLLSMSLASSGQGQTCPGGRAGADYGYRFISCVDCLKVTRVGTRQYTTFSAEPVLHQIRPDGPSAGLLQDRDTLVSVNGHHATTLEAGMLLSDWQPEPVTFVVRRNGAERTIAVKPDRYCVPERQSFMSAQAPRGTRLGVAIECNRCRIVVGEDGRERWNYREAPVLLEVLPAGPAGLAGLRKGDTLIAVDRLPITSPAAAERLGSITRGRSMEWTVRRDGRTVTVTVDPDLRGDSTVVRIRPRR
jgi:S1-C subfamily serine protease